MVRVLLPYHWRNPSFYCSVYGVSRVSARSLALQQPSEKKRHGAKPPKMTFGLWLMLSGPAERLGG
jgi:hypothetical protein